MKKILKHKNKILIIILFIIFLLLLNNIPIMGIDDYKLNAPDLFFKHYINDVISWSVRSGETIAYLIGRFPKIVFNIINSGMIILFLYLIYYYSFSKSKLKKTSFIISFLLSIAAIFYLFPAMYENFFWMAGACNHLYGVCFNLLFLIPFYNIFFNKKTNFKNKIYYFAYLLLAIISGLALENIGIYIILLMLAAIIWDKINNKRKLIDYKKEIIAFFIYLAGYVYLLFSPSSVARKKFYFKNIYFYNNGNATNRLYKLIKIFFNENKVFIYIFLLLLVTFIIYNLIKKKKIEKVIKINIVLCIGTIITLLILLFSPYYTSRTALFILFFMTVVCNYIVTYFISKKNILKLLSIVIVIVFDFYFFINLNNVYKNYYKTVMKIKKSILEQKNQEKIYIVIPNCNYKQRIIRDNEVTQSDYYLKRYYGLSYEKKISINYSYNSSNYCVKNNILINTDY